MFGVILILIIIILLLNSEKKTKKSQKANNESDKPWVPEWCFNTSTKLWEHVGPGKGELPIFSTEQHNGDLQHGKDVDYTQAYQAKLLLTKNEWYEYKKLKQYAAAKGYQVCPKVRLLDLLEPRHGDGYMSALGKIQSKHVDFVITDQDLRVKAILELDDSSHNEPDRKERDVFVDQVLTGVGYKIIHTRAVTEDTLSDLQ